MALDFEKEIDKDKSIDESNLIGELKGIKDLLYKWNTLLAKNVSSMKKLKIEYGRLKLEKHKYYKHDFEELLKDSDIKTYIDGDIDIVKLKNDIRIAEAVVDMLKNAVFTIREKGKLLKELIDLQKMEIL